MQRGLRVCSEVCGCAARSVGVQRGRRVCSEVGGCPASQEGVQRVRECAARLNKVYRVGSCAAKNTSNGTKAISQSFTFRPSGFEPAIIARRDDPIPLCQNSLNFHNFYYHYETNSYCSS